MEPLYADPNIVQFDFPTSVSELSSAPANPVRNPEYADPNPNLDFVSRYAYYAEVDWSAYGARETVNGRVDDTEVRDRAVRYYYGLQN